VELDLFLIECMRKLESYGLRSFFILPNRECQKVA
jgi:hypothetical protein